MNEPLLQMQGIGKTFPGVRALHDVNLQLHSGEVLGLVGENGAGKSTLLKILAGAHAPSTGTLHLQGKETTFASPHDAHSQGIAVIHQELNLVPSLSASANVMLGQERTRNGIIRRSEERRRTRELFARLGASIHPSTLCRRLTVAQQQIVEIAKALVVDARIVVMDEPSAALTAHEIDRLFDIIGDLKSQGIGIIYVSHRLEEIFALADRVMVLRDGEVVGERSVDQVTRGELIQMMVGRELKDEFPTRSVPMGEPRLVVKGLTRGNAVQDVSFQVKRGEVLGLTGLVGAGRTETVRLIFGADARDAGEIILDDNPLSIQSPRDAIRAGIGLLTEDRKLQGLVLAHGCRENFGLPNLDWLSQGGFVRHREERDAFAAFVSSLTIRLPHQDQPARLLSGGNQQKVVLAKWLARNCEVLIFDEPTRGIDVGAKHEIYLLINELAAQGKAIVLISSDLPEVLGTCDRILVMRNGQICGEIDNVEQATQEQILKLAMGEA